MASKHSFGWIPDIPDKRDLKYRVRQPSAPLKSVNLADKFIIPERKQQAQLGSCTANGIGGVIEFNVLNKHVGADIPEIPVSRLFIYYNERVMEHSVKSDAGAMIRDGIKSVGKQGVCPESQWPYNIAKFANKPTPACYKEALKFKALKYERIDNTNKQALWDCLNSGFPFVYGFTVYESFESAPVAKTGVVPMPKNSERVLGGHCVYAYGYEAKTDRFICANSWGTGWANKGDFTIPAAYLIDLNLADDFWKVTTIL